MFLIRNILCKSKGNYGGKEKLKTEQEKSEQESCFRRFAHFVRKDTSGRNEPNKTIVIIRILLLTDIVYFAINLLLCALFFSRTESIMVFAAFLVSYIVIFVLSYYGKTTAVLWSFIVSTLVWILSIVHFLGWDTGVQHFLMILLILYFFSRYKNYVRKVLFALGLVVMRIWMFYVYNSRIPMLELPAEDIAILQILNTVTIFWCISVVSFICSESSQELEGKLVEYNHLLEIQANTDALTGLYNRRRAMEQLFELTEDKSAGQKFSVCIADIDFFKKINDNYGHDFGDEVLKVVAGIIKDVMHGTDMVARWGGEEFLFLFVGDNGEVVLHKIEELRKKVMKTPIVKDGKEVHVTMTFGIAEFDPHGGLEATLKEADEKLYIGKERGRDRVVF